MNGFYGIASVLGTWTICKFVTTHLVPESSNRNFNSLDELTSSWAFQPLAPSLTTTPPFKLFQSSPRYGPLKNLLVQDDSVGFKVVLWLPRVLERFQLTKFDLFWSQAVPSDKQTYSGYLGGDALDAILGVRQCPVRSMTMCVTSPAELSKCVRMRTAMKAQLLQPEMSCYRADTNYGCMRVRAPTSFSLSRTSFLICRNAGHPRRLGRRDHDGRRRRLLGRPAL